MTELATAFTTAITAAAGDVSGLVTDNIAIIISVPVVFLGLRYIRKMIRSL